MRIALAVGAVSLIASAGAVGEVRGQVVQLPEFHTFGVGTSVLVPDRGSASLGGVSWAREGSVSRGIPLLGGPLFGSRAYGREVGASTARVHATIHDFEAMDEALLSEAARRRGPATYVEAPVAAERRLGPAAGQGGAQAPAAAGAEEVVPDRAAAYLAQAEAALSTGRTAAAKVYFGLALRQAPDAPAFRRALEAKLAELP